MKLFGLFRRKINIKSVLPVSVSSASNENDTKHGGNSIGIVGDESSRGALKKSLSQLVRELFQEKKIIVAMLIILMCIMVILSQMIVTHPAHEKIDLNYALVFQLVSSITFVLDFIAEYIFQQETFILEICHVFALIIFLLPNLLIFFDILTCGASPLVFYFQYISMLCVLTYKVQTVADPTVKLDNNYYRLVSFAIVSSIIAFCYNLSRFDIIPGGVLWKALFVTSMILLELFAIIQAVLFTRNSYRFKKKILYVPSHRLILQSFLILLFFTILPIIGYLVTINDDLIFFPTKTNDNFRIVYYFAVCILGLVMVRNFEIREEVNTLKTQVEHNRKMTRSISHEIRTPLTTAFMGLELLQDGLKYPNPKETEADRLVHFSENVDNIREACLISLGILNQLLTFDKLASGMLTIEKKLVPLVSLLEVNAKLFRMQAIQGGINFGLDMNQDEKSFYSDIVLHIDDFKINQVIRNLLSNAMKFTPKKGSVRIKTSITGLSNGQHSFRGNGYYQPIEESGWFHRVKHLLPFLWNEEDDGSMSFNMTTSRSGGSTSSISMKSISPPHIDGCKFVGMLRILIVDSGPGITKEDQKKLFQEYVQISPGELQKGQGSGLGLSISKSIVTLHGGKIGVNSMGKNQGSTFYIELPAYRRHSSSFTNETRSEIDRDNGRSLTVECPQPNSVSTAVLRQQNINGSDPERSTSSFISYHPEDYPSRNGSIMNPYQSRSSSVFFAPRMNSHEESGQESHLKNEHLYPRERGLIRSSLATTVDAYEQYDGSYKAAEGVQIYKASTPSHLENEFSSPKATAEQLVGHGIGRFAGLARPYNSMIASSMNRYQDSSPSPSHMNRYGHNIGQSPPGSSPQRSLTSRPRFGSHIFSRKLHVLVVDDSTMNRKMLAMLLSRDGHIVVEADDGNVAVDYIRGMLEYYKELQAQQRMEAIRSITAQKSSMTNDNASNAVGNRAGIRGAHPFLHALSTVQDYSSLADFSGDDATSQHPHTLTVSHSHPQPGTANSIASLGNISSSSHTLASSQESVQNTEWNRETAGSSSRRLTDQSTAITSCSHLEVTENIDGTLTASDHASPQLSPCSSSGKKFVTKSTSQHMYENGPIQESQELEMQDAADDSTDPIPMQSGVERNNLPNSSSIAISPNHSRSMSSSAESIHSIASPPFQPIDIILIDNYMKIMDGPQAVKLIRRLGFTGPMLGVSGIIDEECDAFLKSGIDLILQKPINMASIWNALKSMKYNL